MAATRKGIFEASTPWHDYNWDAILAGEGFADRYFLRAGLIRKDRLVAFVPSKYHPETAVVRSFEELGLALRQFRAAAEEGADDVQFVLKKAQSSNASGMRFLSGHDARAVASTADAERSAGCACSAASAAAAAAVVANTVVAWQAIASNGSRWSHAMSTISRAKAIGSAAFTALAPLAIALWVGTAGVSSVLWNFGIRTWPSSLPPSSQAVSSELQNEMLQGTGAVGKERACIWVLQRHIEPWLHDGRKFHLRALLLCIGDLQAYIHEDVRMLVATEPFMAGRRDTSKVFALVTNMGASGRHEEYNQLAQNLPLAALGEDVSRMIFNGIAEVLGATLVRVRNAGRRHFFTTPNCWELFGADFLVQAVTGRVFLLEVNPSPSLAMYGEGSGPELREQLVGINPLQDVTPGWHSVPLVDVGDH